MGFQYKTSLPATNLAFRQSLFKGSIYILPANSLSKKFAARLRKTIRAVFEDVYKLEKKIGRAHV